MTSKNNKPLLCTCIQPWKNNSDPTAPPTPQTEEALMMDLKHTICKLWLENKGKCESYTLDDATSDAYMAFRKAVNKDRLAPKITKKVECPCCSTRFNPDCPGDERADHIYNVAPNYRVPTKRVINIRCDECGHSWNHTLYKTKFSTHVYAFIRGEIQQGIRKARSKALSMDNTIGEDGSLHDVLGSEDEHKESIPVELSEHIYAVIDGLSERHKETAALFYGIGGQGICDKTIKRSVKCHHCDHEEEVDVDYSISVNFHKCSDCGTEIAVDMRMNQTDIANQFNISKQRIGSILKKVNGKLVDGLTPLIKKYGLSY